MKLQFTQRSIRAGTTFKLLPSSSSQRGLNSWFSQTGSEPNISFMFICIDMDRDDDWLPSPTVTLGKKNKELPRSTTKVFAKFLTICLESHVIGLSPIHHNYQYEQKTTITSKIQYFRHWDYSDLLNNYKYYNHRTGNTLTVRLICMTPTINMTNM